MAFVLNDRVKETTTTTGTGTVNLGGAATGFETFVAGVGNSNSTYYCIAGQTTAEFEVGIGTVTDASPDTLSRTTILSSSNSDSAVDFSAGTKDVFCTLPAAKTIREFDTAVNIPTGTTAQRSSSAVAGDFRYNTSTGRFEGYSSAWNALGGSNTFSTDIFAGDGSDTTFTLSQSIENENDLFVFIDGVFQAHNSYSVSGTTLTFSTAPANGRVITAYSVKSAVSGNNVTISTMDGDGSDTTLTLAADPVNENNVQVYIDGVYQNKDTFAVSGTTLTFSAAPPNGTKVEAITLTQTNINTATQLADADGDTKVQVEESSDEDKIRFDTGGTERAIIDSTGLGIGTSSPSAPLTVSTTGSGDAVIIESTEAGSSNAPDLVLHRNSASPADDDSLGIIRFRGENDASEAIDLINIFGQVTDVSDGSEDSTLYFKTYTDGAEQSPLTLVGANVGIATTSPAEKLEVAGNIFVNTSGNPNLTVKTSGAGNNPYVRIQADSNYWDLQTLFSNTNNELDFRYNGSSKMIIDSSGNVGIGTTSPPHKLSVFGTGSGNATVQIEGEGGADPYINFLANNAQHWSLGVDDSDSDKFKISEHSALGTNDYFVVDTSGRVNIGATASTGQAGTIFPQGYRGRQGVGGTETNTFNLAFQASGATQVWIDYTNIGNLTVSSDYRIKRNIETQTADALTRVKQIRPVTYQRAKYQELFEQGDEVKEGFIAHELAEIIPSAVEGEKDSSNQIQSLNLDALCSVLTKAIQEQQELIETLQAKVEALENG